MARCVIVILVLAAACSRDQRGGAGVERGDCRAGSAKPCDPGLLCLSNVCVRPPAADCALVGETVASMELGNYAEPEARAPIVAKYKAACEKAHISKDEGECLDRARDRWSAGQCAPRMFPEMASSDSADCKQVGAKVEAAIKASVTQDNPQMAQWSQTITKVMQQSCEEDAWPDGLKQCILTAQLTSGVDAMQACNQQMPPALQGKLSQRLATAMQSQNK